MAQSLNKLALLFDGQSHYAKGDPLYQRSTTINEKALGPDHPNVAISLENYATMLRKMARDAEAERTEGRAQAIRAKLGEENPTE